jgi:hypothetical protein
MSRIDQNKVNIGPAKIKTEDAIYDSVDQGVVGASTTVVIPPPTVIPLPPASLQLAPGYPIGVDEIGLTDLDLNGFPSIRPGPWVIGDLTASGYFTRTLVCNIEDGTGAGLGLNNLYFVNLDDVSQKFNYFADQGGLLELEYVIRDGLLTCGFHYFVNGNWVIAPGYHPNTTNNAASGVSDSQYHYTHVSLGVYKYPNMGPPSVELAKSITIGYEFDLVCVTGDVFWFAKLNVLDSEKSLAAIGPNGLVNTYNLYPNIPYAPDRYDSRCSFFGLNNGSICFLQKIVMGPDDIFHLHTMDPLGNVTTILNFMQIRSSFGLQQFVKVPGQEYMFGVTGDIPKRIYKISNFDYQEINGLPTEIIKPYFNTPTMSLRFVGSNMGSARSWSLHEYSL